MQSWLEPLYRQQIAGLFDPRTRTLYYREGGEEGLGRMVLAHELAHALVDQHFDLKAFMYDPRVQKESEVQLARQALAEGDAFLVTLVYQWRQWGQDVSVQDIVDLDPSLLEGTIGAASSLGFTDEPVPDWLVRLFLSPYLDGYRLVSAAYRRGGWEAVNDLYRHPPETTEQILHPESYFQQEPVQHPRLPDVNPPARVEFSEVFGELSWKLFLEHFLQDDAAAAQAAEGWDGDQARLSSAPDSDVWVLEAVTVWDDEREAGEFAAALRKALDRRRRTSGLWPIRYSAEQHGNEVRMKVEGPTPKPSTHPGPTPHPEPKHREKSYGDFAGREGIWGTREESILSRLLCKKKG